METVWSMRDLDMGQKEAGCKRALNEPRGPLTWGAWHAEESKEHWRRVCGEGRE